MEGILIFQTFPSPRRKVVNRGLRIVGVGGSFAICAKYIIQIPVRRHLQRSSVYGPPISYFDPYGECRSWRIIMGGGNVGQLSETFEIWGWCRGIQECTIREFRIVRSRGSCSEFHGTSGNHEVYFQNNIGNSRKVRSCSKPWSALESQKRFWKGPVSSPREW